ncbi:virion structural protein [uncultured phage cr151_1]|uniref:Phage stabilization protein n=1 Tax=uncultured phage cr151_1 TaxID=2986406 RepID=A0AAE7RVK0_9CAUD|nr:virion structural protein [uncultured phage cr151_1]QWM89475.1 phage stabilization protein [uncultured phage cr151_1]
MVMKSSQHIIKGMTRDLTVSKFNPEFAYECKNIRITARDNSTLLTVTNERGNSELSILTSNGNPLQVLGTLIGYNVLNNYVTLFTTGDKDRIYRLENKQTYFEGKLLYEGNLNFNVNNPIENISVYENDNIQKVYWIDGLNQSRVINIVADSTVSGSWNDSSFDFVQDLELKETVTVVRDDLASGSFSSGVIQYAFTYYNKYGQESNIFYTSPIQYISFASRGASPEEKVSNSFTITIANPDTRFDYIRVYSIHRASIDATPNVLNVVDLPINAANVRAGETLTYTDNGTIGTNVDPTELLYVGGEEVVFGTMTQKDNTLFLGNADIKRKLVGPDIINSIKGGNISFNQRYVGNYVRTAGYYPYKNSLYLGSKIKSFKYLEWYRFGVQFQYKNGKWSEPIWINDAYNGPASGGMGYGISPSYNGALTTVQASYSLNSDIINKVVAQGFIRARGVVVYPTLIDREVVAQGILCPTVYNIGDRFGNSPFAQSSWFARPNLAFDIERNKSNWNGIGTLFGDYDKSKAAVISNKNVNLTIDPGTPSAKTTLIDIVNKGAWAEFRHNKPVPNNWERNAEIQCIANTPAGPYTASKGSELNSYTANHAEYFFVDQNILTLHSPDIEFDEGVQNLDSSGLKLRIVGVVPITANASEIDIQTSTPANDTSKMGFYKETIGSENNSYHGLKNLISGAFWFDKMTNMKNVDDDHGYTESFFVYAWHRNGSLNNQGPVTEGSRTAMLDKKKISNLKFSSFSKYFNEPWLAYKANDATHTGITGVSIFNSNEQSLVRIPAPANSNLGDLNYYGNVDKVIAATRVDDAYSLTFDFSDGPKTEEFNRKNGYPIVVTGVNTAESLAHQLFTGGTFPIQFVKRSDGATLTEVPNGTDAVRMKYKSTPHAVFALNYATDGRQIVMPTNRETDYTDYWNVNDANVTKGGVNHFFWNPTAKSISESKTQINDGVFQDVISEYTSNLTDNNYSYLYLAELYNDNITNRFGGQTEEAFENNIWLPGGEPINLLNADGTPVSYASLTYTEGDTFLERYDCLKTYSYTLEDQNSVTEIVSFMCETRVNIEGRYDRNRGQLNNLTMTPENFNKVNKVYSQKNNFFNYRGINHSKFNLNYFPNTVTWTKEKQLGSIIDTWTNITMASTLDLDGDKGEVISLNTYNNEIFCFQRKGFSNILFNSRVQIPASDGMPIEITNGMKVSGKRYVSNTIGCSNKWSIVESPSGLYFIDNETNSMYLFNGEVKSISDSLGMRQWVNENNTHINWNPVTYENFRGFYDKNNNDVYFVNNNWCLCYSELIGQFTSFMSYERVPAMFNVGSEFYAFNNNKLWQQFNGDYNMFFGQYKPYSITVVANADEPADKIFNTVEFRADAYDGDNLAPTKTYDTLDVYNEYQHGRVTLTDLNGRPSPLKRKFRIWRANIPRANTPINGIPANNRDRIRNTWAYVKLSTETPNTYRTVFHDMTIHYFV